MDTLKLKLVRYMGFCELQDLRRQTSNGTQNISLPSFL